MDSEKIRKNALVKLFDPLNSPFSGEENFIFLGEIPNMLEHGIFVGCNTGKIYIGYHIWDFRELTEDEI